MSGENNTTTDATNESKESLDAVIEVTTLEELRGLIKELVGLLRGAGIGSLQTREEKVAFIEKVGGVTQVLGLHTMGDLYAFIRLLHAYHGMLDTAGMMQAAEEVAEAFRQQGMGVEVFHIH